MSRVARVVPPVEAFVERIRTIGTGKKVSAIDAYTFEPKVVPAAKDAIVAALEALVEAVQAL